MTTTIIVQARMGSSRLPGKVLKGVLGKTLLEYQIERLLRVRRADQVIIATTVESKDDPIVTLCTDLKVPCFRGSEEDVLSRYFQAASKYQADTVVRITADCPLIDPVVIDRVIGYYQDHFPRYDYVSNCFKRRYPRGMDTEVFSFKALAEAATEAKLAPEREHVTYFTYKRPERYTLGSVVYEEDFSHYRWTVDTPEDFELIKRMITALYPTNPQFTLEDCLALLEKHPEWAQINAGIKQKTM